MQILALAFLLLAAQRPEAAAQQPSPPVLVVTGNSVILATPDQALVRLGIVRQAAVAQTAQEQANSVAQEILSAITKAGVAQKDIQTSRLVLTPVYNQRTGDQR